jgi:ADP-ribosyl-[dinitrogen reductase] hydrolase
LLIHTFTVPADDPRDLRDRFAGVLLGTAIGDALGLPMEGMGPKAIARDFPEIDHYALLGRTGFVSDDTEQTALVAQSITRSPADLAGFLRAFRRSLFGWFLRLPWGIGWGTLKACFKIGLGFRRTGASSAGNGAAMRSAIIGAFFFDDPDRRRAWSDELARVTHVDPRAVEGARFVAELTASLVAEQVTASLEHLVEGAARIVEEPSVRAAITRAVALAKGGSSLSTAAGELGNTGFVVHTVAIATFCFLRHGDDPELSIVSTIRAGGDTDSNAAIVGAWVGALHGERGLPGRLVGALNDGPFGRTHLRALAADLDVARSGTPAAHARYSPLAALLRNVALYPVVLAHAFRVALRGSR